MLVAISIPIFTSQLEKAREATDQANLRAAYAEVTSAVLTGESTDTANVTTTSDGGWTTNVTLEQTKAGWTGDNTPTIGNATFDASGATPKAQSGSTKNTATVTADKDGKVTIKFN